MKFNASCCATGRAYLTDRYSERVETAEEGLPPASTFARYECRRHGRRGPGRLTCRGGRPPSLPGFRDARTGCRGQLEARANQTRLTIYRTLVRARCRGAPGRRHHKGTPGDPGFRTLLASLQAASGKPGSSRRSARRPRLILPGPTTPGMMSPLGFLADECLRRRQHAADPARTECNAPRQVDFPHG